MASLFGRLLDALVDGIEPLFRRSGGSVRIVAVDEGEDMLFWRVTRGRPKELGRASALSGRIARQLRRSGNGVVELRLAADRVLTRNINLPAAGREFLGPIIEHRLERLTPWKPEKVLFGYAVDRGAGADGTLQVDFAATSADVAAPALKRLEDLGLSPTALGSAGEPLERSLRIDLYRGERDVGRRRLRRTTGLMLILLALVLVPAVGAAVTFNQFASDRLTSLEKRLATKRAVLASANKGGEAEGRDAELIAAKTPEKAMTGLVDRLSGLIPDGTYLTEMTVDGATIRLVGLSDNAPALIGLLDGDSEIADARFAAPVTRDEQDRDSFDISATWVPMQPPADQTAEAAP